MKYPAKFHSLRYSDSIIQYNFNTKLCKQQCLALLTGFTITTVFCCCVNVAILTKVCKNGLCVNHMNLRGVHRKGEESGILLKRQKTKRGYCAYRKANNWTNGYV